MELFTCTLCNEQYPVEFRNIHHKIPQAAGGTDDKDNLEFLCSGCHQTLHAIAKMIQNPKKTGYVDESIALYYPDLNQQKHCRELAFLIVKYSAYKEDGLLDLSERDFPVSITLPLMYHSALRTIANEHRDPNNGRRKMGMSNYLRMLVMTHLEAKYPKLKTAKTLSELLEKPDNISNNLHMEIL